MKLYEMMNLTEPNAVVVIKTKGICYSVLAKCQKYVPVGVLNENVKK